MEERSVTIQDFNSDEITLIKDTICRGASDNELQLFLSIAKKTGLDPFTKQIYCVPRWDSKLNRNVYSAQTSVDGLRLIALRSGHYAGQLGPFWCDTDGVWQDVWIKNTPPVAAKVGILRHDFKEPLWAVAKWDAYKQTDKNGNVTKFWAKMPDLMLSKCAESLALRKGFPHELSGLLSTEEMAQADVVDVVQSLPDPELKTMSGKFKSAGDFTKPEDRAPVEVLRTMTSDEEKATLIGFKILPIGIHAKKRICDVKWEDLNLMANQLDHMNSNGLRPPDSGQLEIVDEIRFYLRNIKNDHGKSAFVDKVVEKPKVDHLKQAQEVVTKIEDSKKKETYTEKQNLSFITDPMRKRLFAIHNKSGWTNEELKNFISGSMGVSSSKNLNSTQYEEICKILVQKIPFIEALNLPVTVSPQAARK